MSSIEKTVETIKGIEKQIKDPRIATSFIVRSITEALGRTYIHEWAADDLINKVIKREVDTALKPTPEHNDQ